jgi:hypothetical protein
MRCSTSQKPNPSNYVPNNGLLFPEKEAKSAVLLRRKSTFPKPSAGPQRKLPVRQILLFFFQKKKQKALFCFAESQLSPNLPLAPKENCLFASNPALLFPEKEAKSVVLLRRKSTFPNPSAKRNHGGLGAGPQSNRLFVEYCSSFSRKRSKKRCFASQKVSFAGRNHMGHLPAKEKIIGFGFWAETRIFLFFVFFANFV